MNMHHYHQYRQWRVAAASCQKQVETEEIPKTIPKVFEEEKRKQELWYEQGQQVVVMEEG